MVTGGLPTGLGVFLGFGGFIESSIPASSCASPDLPLFSLACRRGPYGVCIEGIGRSSCRLEC